MFAPIIRTLLRGINATGSHVSVAEVDNGVEAHEALTREAKRFNGRDAFVWIGPKQHAFPPWPEMRKNGVRTIYYQTEPLPANGGCMLPGMRRPSTSFTANVDEVWDYSEWNLVQCGRQPHAPTLRLLPPGDVGGDAVGGAVAPAAGGNNPRAVFLGDPSLEERAKCFAGLKHLVTPINDVWSEAGLRKLIAARPPPVFVNLHKRCTGGERAERLQPLEAVRLAQLLSLGAIVVSQRANARDEKRYEGLVDFASLEGLPAAIKSLQARGDLEEVGARRASQWKETAKPEVLVAKAMATRFVQS